MYVKLIGLILQYRLFCIIALLILLSTVFNSFSLFSHHQVVVRIIHDSAVNQSARRACPWYFIVWTWSGMWRRTSVCRSSTIQHVPVSRTTTMRTRDWAETRRWVSVGHWSTKTGYHHHHLQLIPHFQSSSTLLAPVTSAVVAALLTRVRQGRRSWNPSPPPLLRPRALQLQPLSPDFLLW